MNIAEYNPKAFDMKCRINKGERTTRSQEPTTPRSYEVQVNLRV